MRYSVILSTAAVILPISLMSCAKTGEKKFLPVVTKVGAEVKAISAEEAQTVCREHYCEDNQIYVANFGGKKPSDPVPTPTSTTPAPGGNLPPTTPGTYPPQPAEQMDYSRTILDVNSAWKISEGSPSITVAVIDSGVDYFHPDLAANIAVNLAEKNGKPGVDDDGDGFVDDIYGWDFYNNRANAFDDNGHGTHCSGIIAAGKNGIGVRGVAPNVKVLPVKFLGADGSGDTADAIKAIDYAVTRGARVISNSWGGGGYSKLLDDAVQRAVNRGVLFVAAAGNESANNDTTASYPANYTNVISVGSSDQRDAKSSFSNYGKKLVEVFAPGSSILSTFPNGQYKVLSGTSMATPQVSGALALALSVKPSLTRLEATDDLCQSSVGSLSEFSQCGRMDVGALVKRVSTR